MKILPQVVFEKSSPSTRSRLATLFELFCEHSPTWYFEHEFFDTFQACLEGKGESGGKVQQNVEKKAS